MFDLEAYTIIANIFPRLLGLIYFFALVPFFFQIKGLLGENGILPIKQYLNLFYNYHPRKCYFYVPSLFWFDASNKTLLSVVGAGTFISILLMLGVYPPVMLFLLYIIYLSIVSAGQEFLSFGWEGFLLEITVNTFLLSLTTVPNLLVWVSLNLILFRFHFQGGAVKLQSRDPTWRDLSAVAYHYQTQPIPNTQAWYMHKLPLWFHKFSTLLMFITELIIPFGIFLTQDIRLFVCASLVGLQFMIWFTGNLSFLNHLTAVFSLILLNNAVLSPFFHVPIPENPSQFLQAFLYIAGGSLFVLQLLQLWNHFFYRRRDFFLHTFSQFHLVNGYGIFAVMTVKRYEIVIEGSDDALEWKEYTFHYKSSELTRRPRRISPFQPRIDWQAWFLPFDSYYREKWFQSLLYHILKGTPEVLILLKGNPFKEAPPKYVRSLMYDYEFSSFQEKKEKGWWWRRTLVGPYSPQIALKGK